MFRYKKGDRSRPPRPDSADTEDRGQGRLQSHQHRDRPRHAGVPPDRLTVAGKGEIRPLPHFCTKVFSARNLPAQKTEAKVACKVINIVTALGMPVSRRIA